MLDFTEGSDVFHCVDCGGEITLEQYRRKVPRCDECEVRALIVNFDWQWDAHS